MGGSPFSRVICRGGSAGRGLVVGCSAGPGFARGTPDDLPELGDSGGSRGGHQQGACDGGQEQGSGQGQDVVNSQEVMFAERAFWMMKTTATTRTAEPAISPVHIPLAGVCRCPRPGGCGTGWGGAEPLAEGGRQRAGRAVWRCWSGHGVTSFTSGSARAGRGRFPCGAGPAAGELVQRLRKNRTTSTMITMRTSVPMPIYMGTPLVSARAEPGCLIRLSQAGGPGWRAPGRVG